MARQRSNQPSLFSKCTTMSITVKAEHELIRMEREIDWERLVDKAILIREKKIKAPTGPTPHYRELLGAVALMAVKNLTFRDAEDLIAYYAPARCLCGLTDTQWHIDHITIFEFTQMLGEEGIKEINAEVLRIASDLGLLNPTELMSDTTAQEAKIPYPNEVGLMAKYASAVGRALRGTGEIFRDAKAKWKKIEGKIKGLVRGSHLFAKTKEQKIKIGKKLLHTIRELQKSVKRPLARCGDRVKGKAVRELKRLTDVMARLSPQIEHFMKTGFVAPKKILHMTMTDIYSIARGKAGKKTEFGLKWGISRIGGGFVTGFLVNNGGHYADQRFCMESIREHKAIFGQAPDVFGYDRGGYSAATVKKVSKMGVKHVGIAPKGKAAWAVSEKMKEKIVRARAQVEGSIGTIKKPIYGFNKPDARSKAAMGRYGQRAIFGFNLRKVVRELQKTQVAPV